MKELAVIELQNVNGGYIPVGSLLCSLIKIV